MEYKIVTSSYAEGLSNTVNSLLKEGWEISGPLNVVTIHAQNRYSGTQHMDTLFKIEYSQALIKK